MAPMRWQGGDRAPSRNSSLLCRLILNWPDPLTGTGILRMRHTDSDSKDWITEGKKQPKTLDRQIQIFVQRAIKAGLDVFTI